MSQPVLPPLIAQMMQPEFYPHPVTPPTSTGGIDTTLEYPEDFYPAPASTIELIQTHVSYVLLTGEYAYKLKKPVNFGFLDYSSLDKRHHFCNEELRLNQRAAADLYLDVVPITQETEGDEPLRFALNGQGPVVEYAVRMRQFPQSTLLTHLYDQGLLTEALLLDLAIAIAAFHQGTHTDDYIRSFGTVGQVRQAFDENFEQTAGYIGGPQTQQQFDETKAYCDRFFADNAALFEERMQQDRIRECHGDLHLRNICLWNDQLFLFDCIEFNEPFRFVDVMFDIAYIVMDLEARQRPDLSTAFLNTYVEQTGDWEGLKVLPIYVSRQTYVRAKVTSFLLDDPTIPAAEKQKAHDTATLYYKLAWDYTQPRQGQLLLMSGLSGSGKTTTARIVAKQLGAIHIRSDAVRKHLGGIPLHQRGGPDLYTPEMTERTYQRLLDLGIELAQAGYTVVLDAKYDRQVLRQAAIAQATAQGIPLHLLHCKAPDEVLAQRVAQRQNDIADATVEVLRQQTFEPFAAPEQPYVVPIETTQPVAPQLERIPQVR